MRPGLRRMIANGLCGLVHLMAPKRLRDWADGMYAESAEISEDGEALRFVVEGIRGLIPRILLAHLEAALVALTGSGHPSGETRKMRAWFDRSQQPRLVGAIASIAAVGLGLAYMTAAGAPAAYLGLNLGALAIGFAVLTAAVRISPTAGRWHGIEILALASILLATSLFGRSVEGAARWLALGPVFVQPSLIFLPVMIVGFARGPSVLATAGICVAACALALQPDRAMAGVLLAGLTALALFRLDRFVGAALIGAAFAFIVTLMRPDTLPISAHVDQILFSAFGVHPLAGAAIWTGAALLLAPAIFAARATCQSRAPVMTFGAVWFAAILAAALGNYPTPLVGYGASAIIGYLLCLSALPRCVALRGQAEAHRAGGRDRDRSPWNLRAQSLAIAGFLIFGVTSAEGQEPARDCARTEVEKVEIPNTVWQPGPGGEQIALWPDHVVLQLPDYDGNAEMVGSGSPLVAGRTWNWATYISRPTMTIYRPAHQRSRTAVLVLPGGGYAAVAMDLEGTEICDWVTQQGVTCIVLKYRTPQVWRRGQPPAVLLPLQDAQRAMGLLRAHAADYGIDPDQVGVIGFSAGAHLAAAISNADVRSYDAVDAADHLWRRPNFAVLLYTGRLWDRAAAPTSLTLAPWVEISPSAPPTLLIHAMNDPVDDVRHAIAYGLALHEAGVPVDMRIFAGGCHAFGLRPTTDPITTQWPDMVMQWLGNIDLL